MAALDLFIIAAYLAVILAIGFWCRKRQKTTRHYFLAGRHLPWWAISGSIVATETSAITFVSIPGVAFARGGNFTFLQLVLGYLLGRIVICILFIPAYFRKSLLTIYELLQGKFGPQVKSLAASLFIVMRTIADGVRLLLTSVVMATVWRSFFPGIATPAATAISIAIIGGVMLLFTAAGDRGGHAANSRHPRRFSRRDRDRRSGVQVPHLRFRLRPQTALHVLGGCDRGMLSQHEHSRHRSVHGAAIFVHH